MANTDPVEVAVEILDQFTDDLEKLEKQLDRIDGKRLSVDLDIEDNGQIEAVKAQLKALEKKLATKLDLDVDGFTRAMLLKQLLASDTQSTHEIDVDYKGIPDSAMEGLERLFGSPGGIGDPGGEFLAGINRANARAGKAVGAGPDIPLGPMPDRPGVSTSAAFDRQMTWRRRANMARNVPRNVRRGIGRAVGAARRGAAGVDLLERDPFQTLERSLIRFKPTMVKIMNFVALLAPLLIALAGAALGLAAALGAVALAGGAVVGLGLLGYGDSMAESMEMAQRRVKELKEDLYDVFKPVADAFQPITDGLFDAIPHAATALVAPLKGLAEYGDFFEQAIYGGANWLAALVTAMVDLRQPILDIVALIGQRLGPYLVDLFRWAVTEVYENFGAFENIALIFLDLIAIIYNVSTAVSFVAAAFRPLLAIIVFLTDFLNNDWAVAFLTFITAFALATKAIYALLGALSVLGGAGLTGALMGLAGLVKMMYVYIGAAWEAVGVSTALAGTLSMATLGLSAVVGIAAAGYGMSKIDTTPEPAGGGGYSPSGGRYGSTAGGPTINIYGNVGNSEYQRLKDEFPGMYQNEKQIDAETTK